MSDSVWRTLTEKALGGRSLGTLATATADGVPIAPFYPRPMEEPPSATRERPGRWRIAQRVDHPDPEEANRLALVDLAGGADALTLVWQGETARGYGLSPGAEAVGVALEGVALDLIAVRLDAGTSTLEAAEHFAALATRRRLSSAGLAVDVGFDPFGTFARIGIAGAAGREAFRALLRLTQSAGFVGRPAMADGRPYAEAGAGPAEELAAMVATGVGYLRLLADAGLAPADASAAIAFLVVAEADMLVTIAKCRALRRLWARVEEACGFVPRPIRLHAETAWRTMTRADPATNILRATAAAFAAGVGGADAITILPHTLACGLPDEDARRLARTAQLVLLEEAHLAAVDDPAGGAGAAEAVTDDLCRHAWDLFQTIEREGGMAASLQSGAMRTRIAATAARRRHALATRAQGLVGTSIYPVATSAPVAVAPAPRRLDTLRGPLAYPAGRDAEPFEALRTRVDAIAATRGERPVVRLVLLGSPAACGASATAAANLFAAAGLAATHEPPDADRADAVACLCGGKATGVDEIARAAVGLRARGARIVLMVAFAALDTAPSGIDDVVHPRCDALHMLDMIVACIAADNESEMTETQR